MQAEIKRISRKARRFAIRNKSLQKTAVFKVRDNGKPGVVLLQS